MSNSFSTSSQEVGIVLKYNLINIGISTLLGKPLGVLRKEEGWKGLKGTQSWSNHQRQEHRNEVMSVSGKNGSRVLSQGDRERSEAPVAAGKAVHETRPEDYLQRQKGIYPRGCDLSTFLALIK